MVCCPALWRKQAIRNGEVYVCSYRKTNHSLRATGASELLQAGVPEKIVQERTGHRSVEALRMYERTTTTQHMAVTRILSAHKDENSSSLSKAPTKQSDTSGGVCFSSIFGNATDCVINVTVAGQLK